LNCLNCHSLTIELLDKEKFLKIFEIEKLLLDIGICFDKDVRFSKTSVPNARIWKFGSALCNAKLECHSSCMNCSLTIEFLDKEKLLKIFEIEKLLHDIGICFDKDVRYTGCRVPNYRIWKFGSTLGNAILKCYSSANSDSCTLSIPYFDIEKLLHIELKLLDIGIEFDTGCSQNGKDWELDWSLSGAVFKCHRGRSKENGVVDY